MNATATAPLTDVSLPPLPYVAHEILLATLDEAVNAEALAELLSREPGLAARVLSAANAASFAGSAPVDSLQQAVVRLGLLRLRSLVTGLLVAPLFNASACPGFDTPHFWHEAVATGFTAGQLARPAGLADQAGAAAMAGLLRNIGLLLLAHALPAETDTALRSHAGRPDLDLAAHFREHAGVEPAGAGRMLLDAWSLPETVIDAACARERIPASGPAPLVAAAHAWVAIGFDADGVTAGGLPASAFSASARACRNEWERLAGMAELLGR